MIEKAQDNIGFLLAQTCKAHRNEVEAALNALGLHVGQDMILFQLWQQDGQPQSQLVVSMCVEPPTVNKMVQRMEQAGLVERRPDPEDARVSRVYLTDKGREMEATVCQVWQALEKQLLAGLTLTEQLLLRRLLMQMHTNLNRRQPIALEEVSRE